MVLLVFGILFLIGLGLIVLLIKQVLGDRLADAPACPMCRYCVEGNANSTCPECGNDLGVSGVLASRRQPARRISRAIVVISACLLMLGGCMLFVMDWAEQFAEDLFGRDLQHIGHKYMQVDFTGDLATFKQIEMHCPSPPPWDPPMMILPENSTIMPGLNWTPSRWIRFTVHLDDKQQRHFYFKPGTDSWEVVDSGVHVSPAPGSGDTSTHPDLRMVNIVKAPTDPGSMIRNWVIEIGADRQPVAPGVQQNPEAFIAGRMTDQLLAELDDPTGGTGEKDSLLRDGTTNTEAITGEYGPGFVSRTFRNSGLYQYLPRVSGASLILGCWFMFWGLVLVLVLIPGNRTDTWPLEATD